MDGSKLWGVFFCCSTYAPLQPQHNVCCGIVLSRINASRGKGGWCFGLVARRSRWRIFLAHNGGTLRTSRSIAHKTEPEK